MLTPGGWGRSVQEGPPGHLQRQVRSWSTEAPRGQVAPLCGHCCVSRAQNRIPYKRRPVNVERAESCTYSAFGKYLFFFLIY